MQSPEGTFLMCWGSQFQIQLNWVAFTRRDQRPETGVRSKDPSQLRSLERKRGAGPRSSPRGAEGLQRRQPPPEGAALLTEAEHGASGSDSADVFKPHGVEAGAEVGSRDHSQPRLPERPASVELGRQTHTEEGLGLGPPRALQGVPRGGLTVP